VDLSTSAPLHGHNMLAAWPQSAMTLDETGPRCRHLMPVDHWNVVHLHMCTAPSGSADLERRRFWATTTSGSDPRSPRRVRCCTIPMVHRPMPPMGMCTEDALISSTSSGSWAASGRQNHGRSTDRPTAAQECLRPLRMDSRSACGQLHMSTVATVDRHTFPRGERYRVSIYRGGRSLPQSFQKSLPDSGAMRLTQQ
jgi:hypothetical protein